jgi:transcriptional regulator with XRE-family HTH domain
MLAMSATQKRTYSRHTNQATVLLGKLIRLGRKRRKLTVQELADRTGVSRGTIQRVEKGDRKVEVGIAFEAAAIVGVNLFEADDRAMTMQIGRVDDKIALLPKHVHKAGKAVDDDF